MNGRRRFLGMLAGGAGAAAFGLAAGPAAAKSRDADYHAIFLDLIRAWRRHDVEAVLAHLADDVVWYPAVGGPPMTGKDEVRKALTALAPNRGEERWRIFHHAANDRQLFVEGVDEYLDAKGHRIAVPYAGVLDFRGRLIAGWRDYFDIGTLNRQKAGEPVAAVLEPLVNRAGEP